LTTVVSVRSYSCISGTTSLDTEIGVSPNISRAISAARRSCVVVDVGVDQADGQRLDAAAGVQGFRSGAALPRPAASPPAVGADALFRTDGQLQRRQQRVLDEAHPATEPAGAE
jgi:hypothetical protein